MNESPHSAETAAATDFAEKLYTEGILSTRQGRRQLETLMAYEPDFSLEWACQQMVFRAALAEEGNLLSAYAAICPRLARDLAQARAAGVTFEEYMAQHPASPAEEAEGLWGSFIAALIWAFILHVYYHKRRRLFGGKKQ